MNDMPNDMTEQGKGEVDKRVEEIRQRVEAATPAPWTAEIWYGNEEGGFAAIGPHHKLRGEENSWDEDDPDDGNGKRASVDAVFIAHAREDVPYLLSALSAAQGECERLTERANLSERCYQGAKSVSEDRAQRIAELERDRDEYKGRFERQNDLYAKATERIKELELRNEELTDNALR